MGTQPQLSTKSELAPQKSEDPRGKGFPQILHDRARKSGEELHKLVLSLSTGGVAVSFLALTGKVDPLLTRAQKGSVIAVLAALTIASVCGILGWYSDCHCNYCWAAALQCDDRKQKSALYKRRDTWLGLRRVTGSGLMIFFLAGTISAALYTLMRVLGK